jgi:hypothetical protein
MNARGGSCSLLALATVLLIAAGPAYPAEDHPGQHNMLVVGKESAFLSHLPMFDDLNDAGTDFTSPHRYQVILEASFGTNGGATGVYLEDRRAHPDERMYTLEPDLFVLSRVFTPAEQPALTSYKAAVYRGHLERGGEPIERLDPVEVQVKRVVFARKFDPAAARLRQLTYVLFGQGEDLYLAHLISGPPDFDQIVAVSVPDHRFTAEELRPGVSVVFERDNAASQRLRPGEPALVGRVEFLSPTRQPGFEVQVRPELEYYFEEGELAVPASFDPTEEEVKAGF